MEAFTSLCQGNMTCSPAKALRGISASKGASAWSTGAWVCVMSLPLLNILEMPSTEGNLGSDLFKSNRSSRSLSCFWGAGGQVCWTIFVSSAGSGIPRALQCMGSLIQAGCVLVVFSVLP